jgi:hypothetical protein
MSGEAALDQEKIWFLEEDGERKGPFSETEVISFIKNGHVDSQSSVWKNGYADWIIIKNSELSKYFLTVDPPPLSGDKVKNGLVWWLAFAPILGFIIEYFIGGLIWGKDVSDEHVANLWFITLGLNIFLSVADEKNLQKAGHNTDKIKGWTWLVPVYLYQRATFLKQNLGYFIVWCICFVLILME